ncbi:helix-turn-helix transcriptional regulator [Lactobacillus crispatus]
MKQNYVAKKVGISSANFSSRLNGRLKFNADFALTVSKALDIDPEIFLK